MSDAPFPLVGVRLTVLQEITITRPVGNRIPVRAAFYDKRTRAPLAVDGVTIRARKPNGEILIRRQAMLRNVGVGVFETAIDIDMRGTWGFDVACAFPIETVEEAQLYARQSLVDPYAGTTFLPSASQTLTIGGVLVVLGGTLLQIIPNT